MKDLYDLSNSLGLIKALKNKLMMQWDPAVGKLITVLSEVYIHYSFLDRELNDYTSIWFDKDDKASIAQNRKILNGLQSGSIEIRMQDCIGSCHKIANIYQRYLSPWFKRVLETKEFVLMEQLFKKMDSFDSTFVKGVEKVAAMLTYHSREVMDLILKEQYEEANKLIETHRLELLPENIAIANAMKEIFSLKAEFIKISGAV